MLYSDDPGRAEPDDEVHHWARLEGKSATMADELVQNLQLERQCSQRASRFSNTLVFATLLTVCGLVIVALQSKDPDEPPATTLIESIATRQLVPE